MVLSEFSSNYTNPLRLAPGLAIFFNYCYRLKNKEIQRQNCRVLATREQLHVSEQYTHLLQVYSQ